MSSPNNYPIVNAGLYYVNGLSLQYSTTTTLTLNAGAARDSGDVNDIVLSAPVVISGAVVGVNGVDAAAIVASSWYAVYVIGDSSDYQPTGALLSLNASQPALPFGYDMYRRVGWALVNASANFVKFWQYGNGSQRQYYYDSSISALSAGASSSFTAINLSASVPALTTQVLFDIAFTAASSADIASFLPYGSTSSSGDIRFGTGVVNVQIGSIQVPSQLSSGVPTVLYKVSNTADALTLLTSGYVDYL